MPRIQQYESIAPFAEAPKLPGASVELAAATGKGYEQLGAGLMSFAHSVEKNKEREEVSNLNVDLAEAHKDLKLQMDDELQKGTLDQEKFNESANQRLTEIQENISTKAGRLHFQEQSANMQSHLAEQAAHGAAALAGVRAKESFGKTVDNYSSSLVNDPSGFASTKEMSEKSVDALVKTGGLPAAEGEVLKNAANALYAKSAIHGWVQLDSKTAKEKLDSGEFDQYFNGDVKKQLYGEIRSAEAAAETEILRKEHLQTKANQANWDKTNDEFLKRSQTGNLSTKEILASSLPFQNKEHWISALRSDAEEKAKTDPAVFNDLFHKVVAEDGDPGKIYDPSQLYEYVGKGITLSDVEHLTRFNNKTAEGQALTSQRKAVMSAAREALVKKNALGLPSDPQGELNYAGFLKQVSLEENQMLKEGKPTFELYNPDSPRYLGKKIETFRKTPQQLFKAQMDTLHPNGGLPLPKVAPEVMRKQGESISDWKKRTKGQ